MGLSSLAYLWQRNQKELLKEMIDSHIEAVLIKVATMGLEPNKHLGKTISEMYPYLINIVSKILVILKEFLLALIQNFDVFSLSQFAAKINVDFK